MDVLEPERLPERLVGYFDVIFARALCGIFKDGDPKVFLRTVNRMLRPGGYLRWIDSRTVGDGFCIKTLGPPKKSSAISTTLKIMKRFWHANSFPPRQVMHFPSTEAMADKPSYHRSFRNWPAHHGMDILSLEFKEVPPNLWKPWTEVFLQVAQLHAAYLSDDQETAKSNSISKQDYLYRCEEAASKCQNGVAVTLDGFFELIAQKHQ